VRNILVIPALRRLSQENPEFAASRGYVTRPHLKEKRKREESREF
jgi:hypothetical protein